MTDRRHPEINEEFAEILEKARRSGAAELQTLTPGEVRAQYAVGAKVLAGEPSDLAYAEDLSIDAPETVLPVRLYRPVGSAGDALPLLVYFHGGGWSFGSIDTHDEICRHLCHASEGLVLSVGYRLAPEHKFPAAVNDAICAIRWAGDKARALGADPAKLSVGGDSAGGNLAAVVALDARDTNGPELIGQLLIYPATDMSMRFASHTAFGDGYRLTRPLMIWSALNYLRDGRDMNDPRASPLLAESHAGLPPAIIITAACDPLRDEGQAFAEALCAAGVHVDYKCFPGAVHGFIGMTGVSQTARDCLAFAGGALRIAARKQSNISK